MRRRYYGRDAEKVRSPLTVPSVAATGPTDVWAVGAWFDPDLERLFTLAEHYA